MGLSRAVKVGLINHLFSKSVYAAPAAFYLGVSSTLPTSVGGNITEPADAAYARVQLLVSEFDAALDADPVVVSNNVPVPFPQATADWFSGANIGYMILMDAPAGGNLIGFGAYTRAVTVLLNDTLVVAADKFAVSLL